MSGEFRELNRHSPFAWCALEEMASAEPGEHRISIALRDMYKALAPVEEGAAWFEASDSGPGTPVLALIHQWSAIDAAHKQLDALRKEYEHVIDTATRSDAKVKSELETLAKDCEETALEAMKATGAETTAECAEARSWLSVTQRIRHAAKRLVGA